VQLFFFEWLSEVFGVGWLSTLRISQWIVLALGAGTAILIGVHSMRRSSLDLRHGIFFIAAAVLGGMVFGHLVAVAFKPDRLIEDPWRAVIIFKGGISSFGVYGGAVVGAWALSRWRRRSLWPHADALAPGLLVGAAVARMGCLLSGCDFGRVASTLPWGVRYERGTPAFEHLERLNMVDPYRGVGLAMHPFPVYEALPVCLVGVAALVWPRVYGRLAGQRATACAGLYCIIRAGAESFRGGQNPTFLAGVTVIQWLCLATALAFLALWWHLGHLGTQQQRSPSCSTSHI